MSIATVFGLSPNQIVAADRFNICKCSSQNGVRETRQGEMAEKRRAGAVMSDSASAKCESDREFLSQAGVSALLRGALLKLVESRPEDPVGFLAEHFAHLSSEAEDGGSEHQAVSRALWHLSLAHHSQRSGTVTHILLQLHLLLPHYGMKQ